MYTQLWTKYLPIIRILLKRAKTGEQLFALNAADFEKAGAGRKAGYKFTVVFSNRRVDNVISASIIAKDFASLLLEDAVVRELLQQNDYTITMNTKFQLSIKHVPKAVAEPQATEAAASEALVAPEVPAG